MINEDEGTDRAVASVSVHVACSCGVGTVSHGTVVVRKLGPVNDDNETTTSLNNNMMSLR